jgi:hypothetical protein
MLQINTIFDKICPGKRKLGGTGEHIMHLYQTQAVSNFVYNKEDSDLLKKMAGDEDSTDLNASYITEYEFEEFLKHPRRRRDVREVEYHIAAGWTKVKKRWFQIQGKSIKIDMIGESDIKYVSETRFMFIIVNVLKKVFGFSHSDFTQQYNIVKYSTTLRPDLYLNETRICIEFDEKKGHHKGAKGVEHDEVRDCIMMCLGYDIYHFKEGKDDIKKFVIMFCDIVSKSINLKKLVRSTGELDVTVLRHMLYNHMVSEGMQEQTTKMMVQYVGVDKKKPSIPFDTVRKMLASHALTKKEFLNKIDDVLDQDKTFVNYDLKLLSPRGFKLLAMNIEQRVGVWYMDLEESYDRMIINNLLVTHQRKEGKESIMKKAFDKLILNKTSELTKICKKHEDNNLKLEKNIRSLQKNVKDYKREIDKYREESLQKRLGVSANTTEDSSEHHVYKDGDVIISGKERNIIYSDEHDLTQDNVWNFYEKNINFLEQETREVFHKRMMIITETTYDNYNLESYEHLTYRDIPIVYIESDDECSDNDNSENDNSDNNENENSDNNENENEASGDDSAVSGDEDNFE